MTDFTKLLEYAKTDKQKKTIELCIKYGTISNASRNGSINRSTMRCHIDAVKVFAENKGYAPEVGIDRPLGADSLLGLTGISDMRTNEEGKPTWYKFNIDKMKMHEAMLATVEELKKDIPKSQPVKLIREGLDSKLYNLFPIMDYHLGMYADAGETNGAWNMEIAEETFIKMVDQMVERAPKAETAIFNENGDFMHFDSMKAVTPGHGHILDAACRYPELVPSAIKLMKYAIKRLLETHKKVHIICAEGNHNEVSSVWMRNFLESHYEEDSRVSVDVSRRKYYGFHFGKVFLGFHHGHKKGVGNVTEVLGALFREEFFGSVYRYIHVGHRHHKDIKENLLATVIQHNTMAPGDAHSSGSGYDSERSSSVITYHKDFGYWSEFPVTFDML